MWLLELVGMTALAGTALGIVWRFADDWFERRANRKMVELELSLDEEEDAATAAATPTGSKSN